MSTKQQEARAIGAVAGELGGVLSSVSPFAKAIVPAVLGVVAALVNWLIVGTFDAVSITTAVGGLVSALVVYLVPNRAKAVAAPPSGLSSPKL